MIFAVAAIVLSQAKYDTTNTHPLYDVEPATLKAAWERGAKIGRDKNGDIYKGLDFLRVDLGKVRSPSWQRWRASFALHMPPFARLTTAGFEAGRKFETFESTGQKVVDEVAGAAASPERTIRFHVVLNAWPGISDYNDQVNRPAAEEDTVATDFILVCDGKVVNLKGSTETGTRSLGGTITSPIVDTAQVSTTLGNRTYYSTVTRTTMETRGYTAYQASYNLAFPYFDSEGKAYITKATKKLLLRVIKKSGQVQETEFDLTKAAPRLK
ncbi:MAG: hypothetical protein ACO1SV_07965 [Fimbriimonas sp.]